MNLPAVSFTDQVKTGLLSRLPNESNNVDIFLSHFLAQISTKPQELHIFKKNINDSIVMLTKLMALKLPVAGQDMYYITTYQIKNPKTGEKEERIQLQISYFGMMELAFRAGVEYVYATEVYDKDEFYIARHEAMPFFHRPWLRGKPGAVIGFYVVAKYKGHTYLEYMAYEEMKAFSLTFPKTQKIWGQHFNEMARKTLIKKILKVCPKGAAPELSHAIHTDDEGNYFKDDEKPFIETQTTQEVLPPANIVIPSSLTESPETNLESVKIPAKKDSTEIGLRMKYFVDDIYKLDRGKYGKKLIDMYTDLKQINLTTQNMDTEITRYIEDNFDVKTFSQKKDS